MESDPAVISHNLNIALGLLSEKTYDVSNKQALCLSSLEYINRFTLGSINRDINTEWVKEMKRSIIEMASVGRRTTVTVCIDVRDIQIALTDQEAGNEFKAVIIDSQHRWTAMQELKKENPLMEYKFWLIVYVVHNEDDMKQLFLDLDKRLEITTSDKEQISVRKRFVNAFSDLTEEHEKRRCVQRTKNLPVLRDQEVMRALSRLTTAEIKTKIQNIAEKYKREFESADLPKTSVLYQVINGTKLYQLIHWQSGSWVKEMLGIY